MSDFATPIRIRAQAMARDPQTMRFLLDAPLREGRSLRLDRPIDGPTGGPTGGPTSGPNGGPRAAPLAQALFGVAGVQRVQVDGASIVVTCAPTVDWDRMKAPIAAAIRSALAGTAPPLGDPSAGIEAAAEDDAALLEAVTELLDARANPSIAGHGGKITAESVTDGVVHLRMSGGCQGCASSTLTLRRGVETMLRAALPTIRGIVDVTDHSAGTHPFYRREGGQSPLFRRAVPAGALRIVAGRIDIDPEFLGSKLAMSADDVRAGLATGQITVERLPAAASGHSQLVVRGPSRAWAAEVTPSGAAHEIPPPRSDDAKTKERSELATKIRHLLNTHPPEQEPLTYGALARGLGRLQPGSIRLVTDALELTMYEDAQAGRPLIAARAVSRATGQPGRGFFELARALGRGPRTDETDAAFLHRCLDE